jgi:hypothetical protein
MRRRSFGGTNMPLRYYDPSVQDMASADAGRDLSGVGMIRPRIGGKRRTQQRGTHTRHNTRRSKRHSKRKFAAKGGFTKFAAKGGFIPSIMEPFVASCSKYVVPLALFAGYKLMNTKKRSKK